MHFFADTHIILQSIIVHVSLGMPEFDIRGHLMSVEVKNGNLRLLISHHTKKTKKNSDAILCIYTHMTHGSNIGYVNLA